MPSSRLLPGVLGDDLSPGESFSREDATISGGLEYPHYTRPREFQGLAVPDILLSGNHGAVEKWRQERSKFAPPNGGGFEQMTS